MQERQTKQKTIIYDALKALNHPTATEVYGYVHELHPSVSRATVFRVLGGFAEKGSAQELRLSGNEVRYDYNVMPHYHAHCRACGKVADVEVAGIPTDGLFATANCGFKIDEYSVEFFGVCKECQNS